MRPIDSGDFAKIDTPPQPGAAPMLQWVRVEDLVVDEAYQRPIYGAGRQNVRQIAQGFRWSKFAPVIVAPMPGGKFALIDGQHRATAAALLGIESVPAQVIIADQMEQAAAFKSINGQVTRMHRLALHHAAIAAGDEAASAQARICAEAGVTILKYPKPVNHLAAGETLALGSIAEGLRTYGHEVVVDALRCVTASNNNKPGVLNATVLRALFFVIGGNGQWRAAGERLFKAFDGIDLEIEAEEAKVTRRPKGTAAWEILAGFLIERLREALPSTAAAA
jgi:hypothetical protein